MSPILGVLASGITKSKLITGAYESIASATGTGSSNIITFSSIPSTYTSLQIRANMRGSSGGTGLSDFDIRINGDTAANYAYHSLDANGSTVLAQGSANGTLMEYYNVFPGSAITANVMGTMILDIHDYASTTKNKTVRAFFGVDNNGSGNVVLGSGLWMQTSAITSISLFAQSATTYLSTSSTFSLYGIKA